MRASIQLIVMYCSLLFFTKWGSPVEWRPELLLWSPVTPGVAVVTTTVATGGCNVVTRTTGPVSWPSSLTWLFQFLCDYWLTFCALVALYCILCNSQGTILCPMRQPRRVGFPVNMIFLRRLGSPVAKMRTKFQNDTCILTPKLTPSGLCGVLRWGVLCDIELLLKVKLSNRDSPMHIRLIDHC